MKKRTKLGLAVVLAAGAYAAVKLLDKVELSVTVERDKKTPDEPAQEPESASAEAEGAPAEADDTVAFTLKNKYSHHVDGKDEPIYLFELETPNGVKEIPVTWAHYETYYIGDEVICRETENGIEVL
ncbi:MAG: hypothetical protein E7425_03740 [Ruminococcaceae bacterium]|nr:hypothetical protein [Oscillospiraceae bacterium]